MVIIVVQDHSSLQLLKTQGIHTIQHSQERLVLDKLILHQLRYNLMQQLKLLYQLMVGQLMEVGVCIRVLVLVRVLHMILMMYVADIMNVSLL